MATIKPPTGLGRKSKKLWNDLTSVYDFRADEVRILEDACREVDLIERLETELKTADLVVTGSQGQPVASPLVQEVRQHRMTLKQLFASLKLPDDEASSGSASEAAKGLASARWHRGA